jgi:hypothetical protein
MTTVIDVCNRALSEACTQSVISSLDESSPEAVQCKLWFGKTVERILRAAPWGFARRQVELTLLGTAVDSTAPFPFLYKYRYPTDCEKFRYVLPQPINDPDPAAPMVYTGQPVAGPWTPNRNNRYLVAADYEGGIPSKVILTNVQFALGVYTAYVDNPDLWDSGFEDAVISALAFKLVNPLTGSLQLRQDLRATAEVAIRNAQADNANEAITRYEHTPDWIAARNGYTDCLDSYGSWGMWYATYDSVPWGM